MKEGLILQFTKELKLQFKCWQTMGFANKEKEKGGGQLGHLNFSERNKYLNESKSVLLFTHKLYYK